MAIIDKLGLVLLCIDPIGGGRCDIHIACLLLDIFAEITACILPAAIRGDNLAGLLDRSQVKQVSHSAILLLARRVVFAIEPHKVVLVSVIKVAEIPETIVVILILSLDLRLAGSVSEIPKTIVITVIFFALDSRLRGRSRCGHETQKVLQVAHFGELLLLWLWWLLRIVGFGSG